MDNEYVTYEQALKFNNVLFIDVRSSQEWKDGNIPNSINIPLLNDEERAEIGTIYKQISHKEARKRGIQIVSKKLYELINTIEKLAIDKTIILYCWRGGLRSESLVKISNMLSIKAYKIIGGYRSYRKYVLNELQIKLQKITNNKTFIVLNGMTGVGKTEILTKLQEQGYPTLNLEEFAGHRGSAFGSIGLESINSQKQFDSLLLDRLIEIGETSYYIIEAESKRIGKVIVPDVIITAKECGIHIMIDAPYEKRVERIKKEYLKDKNADDLLPVIKGQIESIRKGISIEIYQQIVNAINEKDIDSIILKLIINYYDPKYIYKFKKYNNIKYTIDAVNMEVSIDKLIKIIKEVNYEYFN